MYSHVHVQHYSTSFEEQLLVVSSSSTMPGSNLGTSPLCRKCLQPCLKNVVHHEITTKQQTSNVLDLSATWSIVVRLPTLQQGHFEVAPTPQH